MPPTQPVVIYSDNFSTYPLGSFPTGWTPSPFSNATVVNDPTIPPAFNRVLQFGADSDIYKDLSKLYSSASVFFAFLANGQEVLRSSLFGCENSDVNEQNFPNTLASVDIESDFTLSCRAGINGPLIGNSKVPIANNWNFIQVNVELGQLGGFVTATMGLALNGVVVINTSMKTSTIPITNLFYPFPAWNFWKFSSPNFFGGNITNVFLCELTELCNAPFDFTTGGVYTGSKSFGRVTQGFHEVALHPENPNLRVTQGFIEVAKRPSSGNLRVSQVFIELMTKSQSPSNPQGWNVKES